MATLDGAGGALICGIRGVAMRGVRLSSIGVGVVAALWSAGVIRAPT
jgi:hypothetical protein